MKKSILPIALLLSLSISSCKKEGCTSSVAENYNADAKKDDGSCTFQGSNVIWFDEATANELQSFSITSLTYKIDGAIVGSVGTNVFFTGQPSCGQVGATTVTIDLGKNTSGTKVLEIFDQDGLLLDNPVISFTSDGCSSTKVQ